MPIHRLTVPHKVFVLTLALAVQSATSGAAQTNTGELSGVVRDESGGVLPGTTVTASHAASGFTAVRVTDADGRFFMSSLPIGEWDVVVELSGFRRSVQTGVVLELGRTFELQYTLNLGPITETITVEASAPLLQATTAEISDVIEHRQVEQVPLNGRQFLQLAQLSDAVVIPPPGAPPSSKRDHYQTSGDNARDTISTCSMASR